MKVTLPDGSALTLPDGASGYDLASTIGPRLAQAAIAVVCTVNGQPETRDLHAPLPGDCAVRILTASDDSPEALHVLRHSTAHVMAEAICHLFPGTRLAYGPPLEDGFYYDLECPKNITPDDFPRIEAEMERIVREDRPFKRCDLPRAEGLSKVRAEGNRFKVDNAERADGDALSFYVTGAEPGRYFEDLCRGPHVPRTGFIGAFSVQQVSGSYYRGDVNEQQLQRVYGTAFFKKAALKEHLRRLEEARKRDHRVLGRELNLFALSPQVGSGLVLWQPHGAIVRTMLENFLKAELVLRGFQPVFTPHIGRLELYRTSGHYPYYEDSQYPPLYETDRGRSLLCLRNVIRRTAALPPEQQGPGRDKVRRLAEALIENLGPINELNLDAPFADMEAAVESALCREDGYLLKPMNCPHHVNIFKAGPHSYRDLPVRLAEFGTVYRYEQSGELGGMIRVRGFTQDDAHIFCTPEQVTQELRSTVEVSQLVLSTLNFEDYRVRVGLRDPASNKYTGNAELWSRAEDNLRGIVRDMGLTASEEAGEAAFYGPKIDFIVRDCIGREWQLGTVQLDYNLPQRFDLSYVGSDNRLHQPVMIHRAPFGSMERFVGILIEHFAGAFPLWLAPVQVAVASVSEKSAAYARQVHERLICAALRTQLDASSDKIGPKKHRLRAEKIPYILVVGENEAAEGTVNINDRNGVTLGSYPLEKFLEWALFEIQTKGKQRHAGHPQS